MAKQHTDTESELRELDVSSFQKLQDAALNNDADEYRNQNLDAMLEAKGERDETRRHWDRYWKHVEKSFDAVNAKSSGDLTEEERASRFMLAAILKPWEEVKRLLQEESGEVRLKYLNFGVMEAVRYATAERVEQFLKEGASVNARWGEGKTPLMRAIENGQYELAQELLTGGADVNIEEEDYGLTALQIAASQDNPQIVKALLEHKADINKADQNGQTPLMTAVSTCKSAKVVCALLEAGAETEVGGSNEALLHCALGGRSLGESRAAADEIMYVLLSVIQPSEREKNAVERKLEESHVKVEVQAEWRDEWEKWFIRANLARGYTQEIQEIKRARAHKAPEGDDEQSIVFSDWWSHHPPGHLISLNQAVRNGDPQLLAALLNAGANVDGKNSKGETPLMWAMQGGNVQMVGQLLEAGADIYAQDNRGRTALDAGCNNLHVLYILLSVMDPSKRPVRLKNSGENYQLALTTAGLAESYGEDISKIKERRAALSEAALSEKENGLSGRSWQERIPPSPRGRDEQDAEQQPSKKSRVHPG